MAKTRSTQPPGDVTTRPAPSRGNQVEGEDGVRARGPKRAAGEGSIKRHPTSGMWRGRLMVGRKPDGRPDVREVYAKSQADCRRKLDKLKAQLADGLLPARAQPDSVATYIDRWLAAKRLTVRQRTHERYATLMRLHIVPTLGKQKLPVLKPDQLERLYAAKLAEGLSPRTVHHVHTVFHTALEQALRWGYVPRNIADAVTPPSVPRVEMRPPTGDEVARLLDAAGREGDRLRALWLVASYTGMRLGELLGLTWEHVDFPAGVVRVRRILVGVKGRTPVFGEPKTDRSRRDVALPQDAIDALHAHRDRQRFEREALGDAYAPYGLVFATHIGTPLQRKVVQEAFKRALERADLRLDIRFHDLRHAAATLMLASGEDIPTVAAVLGHSQHSTTLNIYAHAVPEKVRAATSAIQRAVRGTRAT